MPRPKKQKKSPLVAVPPEGASGGTPQTHPWVAPEPEVELPRQPAEPQVEAEPEMEPEPQKTDAETSLAFDKAEADLQLAERDVERIFTVYTDSEFASQLLQPSSPAMSRAPPARSAWSPPTVADRWSAAWEGCLRRGRPPTSGCTAPAGGPATLVTAHSMERALLREERDSFMSELS